MADVAFTNRTHVVSIHGGNCDRFAGKCEKFHFISRAILMDVNDCADIARLKIFAG